MRVGIARIVLQIPGARTLKDRRQVVRSFKDKVRAHQPVSIAEVGDANRLQWVTFGVTVVSGESEICQSVLGAVVSMAEQHPDSVLNDVSTEVIALGDDGRGIEASPAPRKLLQVEPVIRQKRRGP
jgi:uncharacterized protein YlxP (DUF503 family)